MKIRKRFYLILFAIFLHSYSFAQNRDLTKQVNTYVTDWNDAINSKDTTLLSKFYKKDENILFYNKTLYADECLRQKEDFYAKKIDFKQSIMAPITYTVNDGVIHIRFKKASQINSKTTEISASLYIDTTGKNWQIVGESDSLADAIEEKYAATIGDKIQGDFNGDGIQETASYKVIKDYGLENGAVIKIVFSSNLIPAITLNSSRAEITLINEGDLNGIPGDELTLYMPPSGGCSYDVETRGLKNGKWRNVIPFFIYPTACDPLTNTELQSLIFRKNNAYYYKDKRDNDKEQFVEVIHKVGNVVK